VSNKARFSLYRGTTRVSDDGLAADGGDLVMKATTSGLMVLLMACVLPPGVLAQSGDPDLTRITLEELLSIRVVSASRREQPAEDVPAAIYVITQDDIRRSGFTTLPEIFRLVPGMQVAQINASTWAVAVRGFNNLYTNKLLVLIDGRSVYNRIFSGVVWREHDLLLSDIERIEVIRGPGGAEWGANAVSGVINIVTRSAADTQGALVEAGLGTFDGDRVSARYGGAVGDFSYRLYTQFSQFGDAKIGAGAPADDDWESLVAGSRLDWTRGTDDVMAQVKASSTLSNSNYLFLPGPLAPGPALSGPTDAREISAIGRWKRSQGDDAQFTLQAFYSDASRVDDVFRSVERTTDVDTQYERSIAGRHAFMVGGGVRHGVLSTEGSFALSIAPQRYRIFNAFVQDEITMGPLSLSLGSKLEHDSEAGWGLLPSARLMWHVSSTQHLWGAVSRARRTPSSSDRSLRAVIGPLPGAPLPTILGYVGNPDVRSEQLTHVEGGYRVRLAAAAGVDVSAFTGSYSDLSGLQQLPPTVEQSGGIPYVFVPLQLVNAVMARASGVEISGRWAPTDAWRLDGSYSLLHVTSEAPGDPPFVPTKPEGQYAPAHQWQVHSSVTPYSRLHLDAAFYRVGRLEAYGIPAYTRLDARAEFRLTRQLSINLTGQNLLRETHREFSGQDTFVRESLIPRSARIHLRWQFR
jgi:iron complex outermembrane receptor protein